jgi:hypothetical protein
MILKSFAAMGALTLLSRPHMPGHRRKSYVASRLQFNGANPSLAKARPIKQREIGFHTSLINTYVGSAGRRFLRRWELVSASLATSTVSAEWLLSPVRIKGKIVSISRGARYSSTENV